MKILIIRLSSARDIIATTPVIRCIKKQLRQAEIHYLTSAPLQEILAANPYIYKIHIQQENQNKLINDLKKEGFDLLVDLQNDLQTLPLKRLRIKTYTYPKLDTRQWLMVNLKINRLPDISIAERYLKAVAPLEIKNDRQGLNYFIPKETVVNENDIPAAHLAGFIGMAIGGAYYTRKMPAEKLKELCEKINHPIILLGGKDEQKNGELIASADPVKVYNACGKFSFNEQADLVRRSKLLVTHDNAFLQVAAALQKQVVSIWGNTIPEFGYYPFYGKNHLKNNQSLNFDIMENRGLSCRPCSTKGFDHCPRGHFKCMRELDINLILDEVDKRLEAMSGII